MSCKFLQKRFSQVKVHDTRSLRMPRNLGKNLMLRHFPPKNSPAQIGTPFKTKEIWRMKSTVKTSKIAF